MLIGLWGLQDVKNDISKQSSIKQKKKKRKHTVTRF